MPIVLSPITTGSAYDLITLAQLQNALPLLTTAQLVDAPGLITAASRAIAKRCGRPLVLTDFDKVYRPGRTRTIRLDTKPVQGGCRVRTDLVVAMTVQNTDAVTNQAATAQMLPTGPPPNPGAPATLVLKRLASGTWVTNSFTLANYATVAALAAAINLIGGGWVATVGNNLGPATIVQIQQLAPSELNYDGGQTGALLAQCELRWYSRDIDRYVLHDDTGIIELTENRPQAFRYGDYAYGIGYGWSWAAAAEPRHAGVRVTYRAGYATQPADLALGYLPVPDDLQRATIMSVQAGLEATAAPDRVEESAGKYRYKKVDDGPMLLPKSVLEIIGAYYNKQIF